MSDQKSSVLTKLRFLMPIILGGVIFSMLVVMPLLRSRNLPILQDTGPSLTGHILAGSFAHEQKDLSAAIKYYEVALGVNSDNPALLEKLFSLYMSAGDMDKAVGLAPLLLNKEQDVQQAQLVLAVEKFKDKKYEQAEAIIEQTRDDPFSVFVKNMFLMWAAYGRDEDELARAHAETLLGLNTLNTLARWNIARLFEALGDDKRANELFISVIQKNAQNNVMRGSSFFSDYMGFLVAQGRGDEAMMLLESHLPQKDQTPYTLDAYRVVETPNKRNALSPAEGLAMGFLELGVIFSGELPAEITLPYLHQALWLNNKSDKARVVIGELLTGMGDENRALDIYGAVTSSSVSRIFARLSEARILENLGRKAEAQSLLEKLADKETHAFTLQSLADFYRRDEQMAKAELIYNKLIDALGEDESLNWELYFYRGITLEQQDKWDAAEADLLRARRLSGNQPFVLNYLGYSWIDNGVNLYQGLEMIKKAVAQEPRNGFFVDSLGWAFYRMKDFDTAVQFLEKATELEPDDPEIIDHLGDALWQSGRQIEARYQWRRALALEDESAKQKEIEDKIDHGVLQDAAGAGSGTSI
ncbi:hypothetical protein IMCC14465_12070 [alpha proteobacterium IMCC14465]|uniref:Tetratricopeptide repeat protein n=1 Tax=alpha proteobacterium IMCC14465 TaxID=1220535 RepID=J9DHM3_9PROT|nr:hypothetical protein IMCC14465_12070 [alpha proteobacterium IMCC14465]